MGTSKDPLFQSPVVSNSGGRSPSALAIWCAMGSVYLIWGSTYLAIRIAIETLPPFLMAAIRFLIAGGILCLIRRVRREKQLTEWRTSNGKSDFKGTRLQLRKGRPLL